jgi:predicted O-linked N-acetylglucosamine transferase (SPINDLY family)
MILKSLELDSKKAIKHYNLALVLEKLGLTSQASEAYQEAIALNPRLIDAYNNLGNLLSSLGNFEQAEIVFRQAIATNPTHYGAYLNLGNLFWQKSRIDETIELYRSAQNLEFGASEVFNNLITVLSNSELINDAMDVANQASLRFPDDLFFRYRKKLILPRLYENEEETVHYREQFSQGLDELIKQVSLRDAKWRQNALANLDYSLTLPLAYQGKNDLGLQNKFGQLVNLALSSSYSQLMQPLPMPPLSPEGKIRVGYLSHNSHYTVYSLFGGWLKHKSSDAFEIYCYHPAHSQDALTNQATQQVKQYSDIFHYLPDSIEGISNRILSDQLHVLVFLDMIMHPLTTQLAGLCLAPIQCTTWCHPTRIPQVGGRVRGIFQP